MYPALLKKVLDKYASCESYNNTGSEYGYLKSESTFKTYFCRPGLFRFEITSCTGNRLTICSVNDDAIVQMWDGESIETDLKSAIKSTIGVADQSIAFILKLLMPDFESGSLEFTKFGPFLENTLPAEDDELIWVGSDPSKNLHTENLRINPRTLEIVERKVLVYTTESLAAKNAAAYFKDSDPAMSKAYSQTAEEGAQVGFIFGARYNDIVFDDFSEELKSDIFPNS